MTGTSIATLGDIKDGFKLHVYCQADLCHHNSPMNIAVLRERFGNDFPNCDLASRLICSKCGERKAQTIFSPIQTGPGG